MQAENQSPCPNCPKCGGSGFTMKDDMTQAECENLFWRRVGAKLGAEIATAPPLAETPLFVPAAEPPVDKTQRNVFLKGWWGDLLPHFKTTFIRKYHAVGRVEGFYFRIVTDERLKNVYLSNEAYAMKQRKKRDEGETFNSLSDLVGNFYHLVIIRLGFLGYKNVAMPGILKETLLLRQALNLPTWLVEEPESPFGPGHFSWSMDVDDYVKRRFEILDLTKTREGVELEYRGVEGASPIRSEPGMSLDEDAPAAPAPKPATVRTPKSNFEAPATDFDHDPILTGSGNKGAFKYKKGGKGRRSGGDDE